MKRLFFLLIISLFPAAALFAQTNEPDSLPKSLELNEVIVISKSTAGSSKQPKCLSSLDEYLERSSKLTLVKRGGYGWEPMINNMTSERLNLTIDGMHIFGACTDKMDPVTSYVDVSNLEEVNVSSGQNGAYTGHTIGGALDMVRTKPDFSTRGWGGNVDLGAESNSGLITTGAKIKYGNRKFYSSINFMYRDAGNYKDGNGNTVEFSQFTKYNASVTTGIKINDKHLLSGSVIFDNASNVGYPALPMDVSLARAYIADVEHTAVHVNKWIEEWNTKIYYNSVQHVMDDTKRPAVPMHMDMPGWTHTTGIYSKITAAKNRHNIIVNLNAYYNQSKAEMTMYPKDESEPPMFMYTWPDVRTAYTGISISDNISLSQNHSIRFSINPGFRQNRITNTFGLNSLKIFYPDMKASKNRFLYSALAGYGFKKGHIELSAEAAYGERAPSVSEGYGFYLFNSFDKYDYIGNPGLKNEKSLEANTNIIYRNTKFRVNLSASWFHILDYIIGENNPAYSPMTFGASGVRVYKALKYANIFSGSLQIDYRPVNALKTSAFIAYNDGRDYQQQKLPLIRPLSYRLGATYLHKQFEAELTADGASKQTAFSRKYGEDETPAYMVLNFYTGYTLKYNRHKILLRIGVENIGDVFYSTYSDWNNIPRKGRNFFFSVSYGFRQL